MQELTISALILITASGFTAFEDHKHRLVHTLPIFGTMAALVAYDLYTNSVYSIILAAFVLVIGLLASGKLGDQLGLADVLYLPLVFLAFPYNQAGFVLFAAILPALVYATLKSDRPIPYITCLWLGAVLNLLA